MTSTLESIPLVVYQVLQVMRLYHPCRVQYPVRLRAWGSSSLQSMIHFGVSLYGVDDQIIGLPIDIIIQTSEIKCQVKQDTIGESEYPTHRLETNSRKV